MVQDAEAHFEDQISKLVLEKQELEWEKVRLGLAGFTSTSLMSIFWYLDSLDIHKRSQVLVIFI